MTEMMLDIRNLRVSIPTDRGILNAVRGVDLQIAKGETLCLVGESGCGKSLTATSIMGLLPRYAKVTSDRFQMAGQDLTTRTDTLTAEIAGSSSQQAALEQRMAKREADVDSAMTELWKIVGNKSGSAGRKLDDTAEAMKGAQSPRRANA